MTLNAAKFYTGSNIGHLPRRNGYLLVYGSILNRTQVTLTHSVPIW